MYGLLVEPQSFPFGTYICPQSKKTVKNGSKFHGKFAVFCYYLARNDKLGDRNKCQRSSGKSFMKIGYSEVPKPSYLPLLWPAEWKMPAPLLKKKLEHLYLYFVQIYFENIQKSNLEKPSEVPTSPRWLVLRVQRLSIGSKAASTDANTPGELVCKLTAVKFFSLCFHQVTRIFPEQIMYKHVIIFKSLSP